MTSRSFENRLLSQRFDFAEDRPFISPTSRLGRKTILSKREANNEATRTILRFSSLFSSVRFIFPLQTHFFPTCRLSVQKKSDHNNNNIYNEHAAPIHQRARGSQSRRRGDFIRGVRPSPNGTRTGGGRRRRRAGADPRSSRTNHRPHVDGTARPSDAATSPARRLPPSSGRISSSTKPFGQFGAPILPTGRKRRPTLSRPSRKKCRLRLLRPAEAFSISFPRSSEDVDDFTGSTPQIVGIVPIKPSSLAGSHGHVGRRSYYGRRSG